MIENRHILSSRQSCKSIICRKSWFDVECRDSSSRYEFLVARGLTPLHRKNQIY